MTPNSAQSNAVIIVGGGPLGVSVVERIRDQHDTVWFLDSDEDAVEAAAALGAAAQVVDVTSGRALDAAVSETDALELAIVIAERDATALLIGQLVKTRLGVTTVIAPVNDPQNRLAFETAGLIPVCAATVLADAVAATHSIVRLCSSDVSPALVTPPRTSTPSTSRSSPSSSSPSRSSPSRSSPSGGPR